MPFVSITRLRLRSWRYLPGFILQSLRAAWQANRARGNLSTCMMAEADLAFWTRTIWSDEPSMRSFMLSGAHRQTMPRLLDWCDEAAVVHWSQEAPAAPSWAECHQRLLGEGRVSKVAHPSQAQRRFDFPPPRRLAQLRLR